MPSLSHTLAGASSGSRSISRLPTASRSRHVPVSASTPSAHAMRSYVPNRLIATGIVVAAAVLAVAPGCSNSSAGPERLAHPVGDLADLEVAGPRSAVMRLQLPLALEQRHELAEVLDRHASLLGARGSRARCPSGRRGVARPAAPPLG